MTLRTLIVDDEPFARRVPREEREAFADVEVIGEADSGGVRHQGRLPGSMGNPVNSPAITLRTLIVDDEPIARRVLREELEAFADVEVIGEADNGAVAISIIETAQPDLVLLDLRMAAINGGVTTASLSAPWSTK